jgi:hypothetical protein
MIANELQELYKKIIIHYTKGQSANVRDIIGEFSQADMQIWSQLVFQGEQVYGGLSQVQQEQEFAQLFHRVTHSYYTIKLHELSDAIKRAEENREDDLVQRLLREHQAMNRKRNG